MKQQLIVTILGADDVEILSTIAKTVSECHCNILDSRQAVYGQDFSLTMILEGTVSSVTRAELAIPQLCRQFDLLSMSKRTRQHCKQNLEQLAEAKFTGIDTVGVMSSIIAFFADYGAAISAFRQKTYTENNQEMVHCTMMVSLPDTLSFDSIEASYLEMLLQHQLSGVLLKH